jgi:hypothetical protein
MPEQHTARKQPTNTSRPQHAACATATHWRSRLDAVLLQCRTQVAPQRGSAATPPRPSARPAAPRLGHSRRVPLLPQLPEPRPRRRDQHAGGRHAGRAHAHGQGRRALGPDQPRGRAAATAAAAAARRPAPPSAAPPPVEIDLLLTHYSTASCRNPLASYACVTRYEPSRGKLRSCFGSCTARTVVRPCGAPVWCTNLAVQPQRAPPHGRPAAAVVAQIVREE